MFFAFGFNAVERAQIVVRVRRFAPVFFSFFNAVRVNSPPFACTTVSTAEKVIGSAKWVVDAFDDVVKN